MTGKFAIRTIYDSEYNNVIQIEIANNDTIINVNIKPEEFGRALAGFSNQECEIETGNE